MCRRTVHPVGAGHRSPCRVFRRYSRPQRITPDLALLKEVAVAGDFEAVLSFGVGLSGPARVDVQELSSPARLVIDFRRQ